MILSILAFFVSLIPAIGIFVWLRSLRRDLTHQDLCGKALGMGLKSVIPIVLCSAVLSIIGVFFRLAGVGGIPLAFYHNFFVLAFSEELVKFLMARKTLLDTRFKYSWLDVIIVMTIVGIGFGLAEDLVYAFFTNPIQMVVRGVDIGHGGYGFIMGYFMGKALKTGKKHFLAIGFAVPWFLHGLYDFALSEELAVFDASAVIAVNLALISVATIIFAVVFIRKAVHDGRYTKPLPRRFELVKGR